MNMRGMPAGVSHYGWPVAMLREELLDSMKRRDVHRAVYCAFELNMFRHHEDGRVFGVRTNFVNLLMRFFLGDVGLPGAAYWPLLSAAMLSQDCAGLAQIVETLCILPKSSKARHVHALFQANVATWRTAHLQPQFAAIAEMQDDIFAREGNTDFGDWCRFFVADLAARKWTAVAWAQRIVSATGTTVVTDGRRKPVWRLFRMLEEANVPFVQQAREWYTRLENSMDRDLCWVLLIILHVDGAIIPAELPLTFPSATRYTMTDHLNAGRTQLNKHRLENPPPRIEEDPVFLAFYNTVKCQVIVPATLPPKAAAPAALRETELFDFVGRAHLTTGQRKPDVYFARAKLETDDVVYFVKGPLTRSALSKPENQIELNAWKGRHGFPFVPCKIRMIVPNMWTHPGVPTGQRNYCDRRRPQAFMISESVLPDMSRFAFRRQTNNIWKDEQVIDLDRVPMHLVVDETMTEQQRIDYLTIILYRWLFGIPGLHNRHMLVRQDQRVVSVSETVRLSEVDLKRELGETRRALVRSWLETRYDTINPAAWKIPQPMARTSVMTRFTLLQNKATVLSLFE